MPDTLLRPKSELYLRSPSINRRFNWEVREPFPDRPAHHTPSGLLQDPLCGRVEANHSSAGIQDKHARVHLLECHLLSEGDRVKDVKTEPHNSIHNEKNCNRKHFDRKRRTANTGHFQQEYHSHSNLTCRHHNHWPALPRGVHEQPGKDYEIN